MIWEFSSKRLHRPPAIRLVNAVVTALHSIGLARKPFELSIESFMQASMKETGLSDFGDDYWKEPLLRTIESVEREGHLTKIGYLVFRGEAIRYLSHRLRLVEYSKNNPELMLTTQIKKPIFIVGYFRTGTSLLFNILAKDPLNRPLLLWEAQAPFPPVDGPDNRVEFIRKRHKGIAIVAPFMDAVHHLEADGPEECSILLQHSFTGATNSMIYRIPSFDEWITQQDITKAYEYYRDILKVLQIQRSVENGRWLLKAPFHLANLETLLKCFPEACVVWTHRDPLTSVSSICSMKAFFRSISSDDISESEVGRETVMRAAQDISRAMEARKNAPAARFFDVPYNDLIANPVEVIKSMYEHFDLPLTDSTVQCMQDFLQENPKNKFGVHKYSLRQFGINRDDYEHLFSEYRQAYNVPSEMKE